MELTNQDQSIISGAAPKKRLGEALIELGLITNAQLVRALAESKQSGTPVGSILVKKEYITVDQLRDALSQQQGIESVGAKDLQLDVKVIKILPEDFIKINKVVPIRIEDGKVVIAMVNPNDTKVLNDIIYLTGLQPKPLILTHVQYESCLNRFFETKRKTEEALEEMVGELEDDEADAGLWDKLEQELQDQSSGVAKIARSIVTDAIDKAASDIHIEPRKNGYIVRYRIDGTLIKFFEVPQRIEMGLISRLKVIARMNIAEHRRPQDGHFSMKYSGKTYDFRVNTLPVGQQKEKIVIRILLPNLKADDGGNELKLVGATPEDTAAIQKMAKVPSGVILATGPTGSGKTTTLYNLINSVNDEIINITTVEDPVEVAINGINQVQINPKAEITFANAMRAILRQDPDVIMIGEIRDYETLETATRAALTGHLVLSTIHTNSAAATVIRLIEMGIPQYLVASTLSGVIAQRLLRKLCDSCKERYAPSMEELTMILEDTSNLALVEKFREIYKSKGCAKCDYTGYSGRVGVYEIMPITRKLKALITESASEIEIEDTAIREGMNTLQAAALKKIALGGTSIEEFVRVLGIIKR